MPSRNLTRYLAARATGSTVETAATIAGFSLTEARLTEKAIDAGELELPQPSTKEESMDDVKTTMRIAGGPEIPINLDNPDAPENAPAKAAIAKALGRNGNPSGERLRLFIERVERLEEDKKGIGEDISDVFTEAKNDGFDTKTMRRIIKLRKMKPEERQEARALLSTYMDAIGMTPIEEAIALAAAA